jgi:hypothetical protein
MPFKFKLAKRLAVLKFVVLSGALAGSVACEPVAYSLTDPTDTSHQIVELVAVPDSVAIDPADSIQFQAFGWTVDGDSIPVDVAWSADGGAISARGLFKPDPVGGTFRVFSRLLVGAVSDTSRVTVRVPEPPAVAGVKVSPSSTKAEVGDSVRLTAEVRDADGDALMDRALRWSSSHSTVATVDASGLVTAVAEGSATITATSEDVSGSAIVTVQAPAPPSGSWPNQPSGIPVITDYGFDDPIPVTSNGVELGTSGWQAQWNTVGNGSLSLDPGAPLSPTPVYQIKYPVGFPESSAPSTVEYRFDRGPTEMYWAFWWKPSSPFQSHRSGVNKLAFIWSSTHPDHIYFDLGPNPWRIRAMNNLHDGGGPLAGDRLEPNVNTTVITLGEWHRIEIYVKYSTGSDADGVIKWWVDGVLNGSFSNLKMVQDGGFSHVAFSPTYGGAGAGDVKTQDDYYWFDHVRISGR